MTIIIIISHRLYIFDKILGESLDPSHRSVVSSSSPGHVVQVLAQTRPDGKC